MAAPLQAGAHRAPQCSLPHHERRCWPPTPDKPPSTSSSSSSSCCCCRSSRHPSLLGHVITSRASRGGGIVSGSALLSRCLTTAPRREHPPPPLVLGPSCEMSARLNPLVSPHPPSHGDTSADFRKANQRKREIISLSLGRQGPALRGSLP